MEAQGPFVCLDQMGRGSFLFCGVLPRAAFVPHFALGYFLSPLRGLEVGSPLSSFGDQGVCDGTVDSSPRPQEDLSRAEAAPAARSRKRGRGEFRGQGALALNPP